MAEYSVNRPLNSGGSHELFVVHFACVFHPELWR